MLAVDGEADSKVAGLATEIAVIAKGRATGGDGLPQNFFDRACQALIIAVGKLSRGSEGIKVCGMQAFGCVNVADANDDVCIHEEIFNRHASRSALLPQVAGEVRMAQRLDS